LYTAFVVIVLAQGTAVGLRLDGIGLSFFLMMALGLGFRWAEWAIWHGWYGLGNGRAVSGVRCTKGYLYRGLVAAAPPAEFLGKNNLAKLLHILIGVNVYKNF